MAAAAHGESVFFRHPGGDGRGFLPAHLNGASRSALLHGGLQPLLQFFTQLRESGPGSLAGAVGRLIGQARQSDGGYPQQ